MQGIFFMSIMSRIRTKPLSELLVLVLSSATASSA